MGEMRSGGTIEECEENEASHALVRGINDSSSLSGIGVREEEWFRMGPGMVSRVAGGRTRTKEVFEWACLCGVAGVSDHNRISDAR